MSESNPDKLALDELKATGVDLSRPVQVVHYFYSAKRGDAERIGKTVSEEGFSVEMSHAALGDSWLVLAKRTQILSDSTIAELRSFLGKLARTARGGEYDGWEVGV